MNLTCLLNQDALLKSPLFLPLSPVMAQINAVNFPTLIDFNSLLISKPIFVKLGHSVCFVPQEVGKMGFESQYEPRCYLTGEVQTRPNNWHDFFNALVWLTFPKAKAAINRRHYLALLNKADTSGSQRGKVRDMATLFDESGVVVVYANPALADMLCSFKWKELFWQHRAQTNATMGFFIFGHGLYEKGLQPYIGMTGQGLVLEVSPDFFNYSLAEQLNFLDEIIAAYLDDENHCLSTRELHPVPLLGIPGWSADNESGEYYENTDYFRSGRRDLK